MGGEKTTGRSEKEVVSVIEESKSSRKVNVNESKLEDCGCCTMY